MIGDRNGEIRGKSGVTSGWGLIWGERGASGCRSLSVWMSGVPAPAEAGPGPGALPSLRSRVSSLFLRSALPGGAGPRPPQLWSERGAVGTGRIGRPPPAAALAR